MRAVTSSDDTIDLGKLQTGPVIGITDYSRRATDDFGVTTIVERGFARTLSVRLAVPADAVDELQRDLAELRAQSVEWIADDDIDSLKVEGFFKDFSIDLATPPISYCSLSIEGLTEDAVAIATAPHGVAPDGQASTLQLLRPIDVTDSNLTISSVAETDHAEWSGGATYALGARVILAASHRVYESLVAGNIGNNPIATPDKWLDVGPTNRWAMFDKAVGSVTSATGSVAVTIAMDSLDAVALLDVVAATVRVQADAYDRTLAVNSGTVSFLDLDGATGPVIVTIAGPGDVSVGTLLAGDLVALGITEAAPTAGITDFSRKTVDEFGEVTIVQRAWVKRMTAAALIRSDAIDAVVGAVTAVRAQPCLWIGQAGMDTLTIYGFFKDFSIEVGDTLSKLSLTIEGLSTAARVRSLEAALGIDDLIAGVLAAQASADAAGAGIDLLNDDGVITINEKVTKLIPLSAELDAAWGLLNGQAVDVPMAVVVTAKAAAITARTAWLTYRNALTPDWDDFTADTVVGRSDYDTAIGNYRAAIDTLANALRLYSATRAEWDGVSGPGLPEDFATRNDDGANMLTSPLKLDQAELLNGAVFSGDPAAPSVQLFTTNALVRWCPAVECRPNEELFLDYDLRSDGAGAETCNASYIYYDAAGAALGAVNLSDRTQTTLSAVAGIDATIRCKFTTPSTAFRIKPYLERPVATGQSFFARLPYLGRAERGSTKGAVLGVNVVDPVTGTVPTRDEIIPGQVLLDRGIQDGATPGAILDANPVIGNFKDGTGLLLSPFDVITSLGESGSYAGQDVVEERIFEAKQNRVYNSQFKYKLAGWANSLGTFAYYNDWLGTFMSAPLGVGGLGVSTAEKAINCGPSQPVTLSATFRGDASVNQFLFVDVEWRNGGNGALVGYSSTTSNGVFWTNVNTSGDRKSQPFNSPNATDGSGFVKAYIRVVTNSDVPVSTGELLVTKIQLETGSLATAYNEGADDGAILSQTTGQIADSRSLNASNTLGLVALSSPGALGDTVISGQLYLTIGAGTYYTDWGATVSYPSATIGPGPFGLTYHIWRNVSGPGDAGSSYDASPTLTNALGVGKVYLGSVIARASAGDPPGSSSNNGDYVDNGGGIFIPN